MSGLRDVSEEDIDKVVIAYEPVWAISSVRGAKIASPDEVAEVVKLIRGILKEIYGDKIVENVAILYGGSVNPSNAGAYLTVPGVNGLMFAASSLILSEFVDIIDIAKRVRSWTKNI